VRQVAYSKVRDPQDRKYLEDQLAEKIGANPGDVIIYAPNPKMNLKPAEMRVLWKGKPFELRYIDDPIITPRLKQILDAHEALWGIHVLITPNLSERQRSLLKEACDIEFICPREELDDRRQDLYEKLIDETLSGADITKDRKIPEYVKRKREAAAELANAAADRRPWRVQVEAVVRKLFANEEVRDDASRRS
jgi:hypothetical protein